MSPVENPMFENGRDPEQLRRRLRIGGIIAGVIVIAAVAEGLISRALSESRLREWTEAQTIATVAVIAPGHGGDVATLNLPGRLEAYSRASIYARAGGYIKSWKVDIGAHVKAGQLLAEIEAPDIDQQLAQAKADLASAEANMNLSTVTAERWRQLLESHVVSKQDVDDKNGDLAAKQALAKSAAANVQRLQAMVAFTRLVAPFDGIVTARNVDVGQLIVAGSSSGTELFAISDVHKLRVYVSVPQNYVRNITAGTRATIKVPERGDKSYNAVVESTSQAVTAATGTTLIQLAFDNSSGELLPGSYAEVHFELPHAGVALSIPASALIFDAKGLSVATVGTDNRVILKSVTIARDLGKTIEIGSGLDANDQVIDNPPDGIASGTRVRIAGNANAAPVSEGKKQASANERG